MIWFGYGGQDFITDKFLTKIKKYVASQVLQNKPWILGTFTANIDPAIVIIEDLGQGLCVIGIPPNTKLDLTDGQHRKIAIEELCKSSSSTLKHDSFPITIILEEKLKHCQSDFRDMARAKPVEKSLLLSFGDYVGRAGITSNLIDQVFMFSGKIDKFRKAPIKNQPYSS